MSWLTGPWDDRVMNGTDQGGAGEAAAGSVQRRLPAATGWRCLLPRPTLRLRLTVLYGTLFLAAGALLLLLSFLLFRRGLDNALQPPLPHGGLQPPSRLHGPFPTVAPPHSGAASGITQ